MNSMRCAIVIVFVFLIQILQAEDWKFFQGNTAHTGFSLEKTDPILDAKWSFHVGKGIYSSPVSAQGFVYFGGANDTLYCLNGQTGALVWKYGLRNWIEAAPALTEGTVYAVSEDHSLHAVAVNTGLRKWSYETESWMESPPIIVGNNLYVGSSDHYLYCLNAQTGRLNWKFETSKDILGSPSYANGIVYLGSDDDTLYALNTSGGLLWKYGTNGAIYTAPCVTGTNVIFGIIDNGVATPDPSGYFWSYNNKLICLNALTGSLVWQYTTEEWGFVYSSTAVAYGQVYFGTFQGYVRALNLTNGAVSWQTRINDYGISGAIAIADSILYVPSYNGRVYALSAINGAILDDFATEGLIQSSPCIANGKLYFGSHDGWLYCLDIYRGVSVTLVAASTQIPQGGSLAYTATLVNESSTSQSFQYWVDLTLPNGSAFSRNPIYGPSTITIPPGASRTLYLSLAVPMSAPLGKYILTGKVGTYNTIVNDQDSFIFEIIAND